MRTGPRVALLTSRGRGAISVIKVWGPGAAEAVSAVFRPKRPTPLFATDPRRPRLGRIGQGLGDEVVAIVLGPEEVEIHGHAGTAAVTSVLHSLSDAGAYACRSAAWITDVSRSRFEAEAAHALSLASTERGAQVLLDQYLGALPREIERALCSRESPVNFIDTWIDRSRVGIRLVSGVRVVIVGRPNVGKSRLLNALAGYERAIVSPMPGTTRDVVSVRTAVDGVPTEFLDTAGIRFAEDEIERAGVERSNVERDRADLVLLVLDRSEPLTPVDLRLMNEHPRAIRVANKSDLAAAWDAAGVAVSAEFGLGIEDLLAEVARRLAGDAIPPGGGVPFRPRHARLLSRARVLLLEGQDGEARRLLESLLGRRRGPIPSPSSPA